MSVDLDVFVSYSRADEQTARQLVERLRAGGLAVWWDRDLPNGQGFRDNILDAVERARSVVVLWSDASVISPWVAQEALVGLDRKVLVPLALGNPSLPPGLGGLQVMRLPVREEERAAFIGEFAAALRRILEEGPITSPRRGIPIDVTKYNRLSVLRRLAWSLLLGGLAAGLALVASYGSGDMDNIVTQVGLPTVGYAFVARWAVGAPKRAIFVRPEPFFSRRMLGLLLIAGLVMAAIVLFYDRAEPGLPQGPGAQTRFLIRAIPGALFVGLLCAPLIRGGAVLLSLARRRLRPGPERVPEDPAPAAAGRSISWPATRLLVLLGLGAWATVLTATAILPNVSTLDGRRLPPGTQFNDCGDADWCPVLVVLPAGRGIVGSRAGEVGYRPSETPRHAVAIPGLAVGKYEITIGQWRACVAHGGCTNDDPLSHQRVSERRRPYHPIVNLSWTDAQEYVRWLSRRTGQRYRLLSEAEWEYAARAGTTSQWYWGDDPRQACANGNMGDSERMKAADPSQQTHGLCSDGVGADTARVGRYRPNRFGLYDMLGNAEEWVEDCWNESHAGAADTNAARRTGDCRRHVAKGGDYFGMATETGRAASRQAYRNNWSATGLRVARELR